LILNLSDQDILAEIRTLLAVERNYLAIERTQFAQLRTGVAVSFTGPPAAGAIGYLLTYFKEATVVSYAVYASLGLLTVWGIWVTYRAYTGLRKTRKALQEIVKAEVYAAKKSEKIDDLMNHFLSHEILD
jgi:uncharacterized membrane protein YidH (DUF202 family)